MSTWSVTIWVPTRQAMPATEFPESGASRVIFICSRLCTIIIDKILLGLFRTWSINDLFWRSGPFGPPWFFRRRSGRHCPYRRALQHRSRQRSRRARIRHKPRYIILFQLSLYTFDLKIFIKLCKGHVDIYVNNGQQQPGCEDKIGDLVNSADKLVTLTNLQGIFFF